MKKIVSILLACVILFFSMGFTLSTHLCGGKAVNTILSLHEKAEGCGMEVAAKNCEGESASKKSCCNDNILAFQIEDDYQPTQKVEKFDFKFAVSFIYSYVFHFNTVEKSSFIEDDSPPDIAYDYIVRHQVFII